MHEDDGPNTVFAVAIVVFSALAAISWGLTFMTSALIGINAGGLYDLYGRVSTEFTADSLLWPDAGAALQWIPVWICALGVDVFATGTYCGFW